MSNTTTTSSGGIGFLGLLTILFIGLKLTDYIDWSWWWVLSPLWFPVAVLLVLIALFGAFVGVVKLLERRQLAKWRNNLRNNSKRK